MPEECYVFSQWNKIDELSSYMRNKNCYRIIDSVYELLLKSEDVRVPKEWKHEYELITPYSVGEIKLNAKGIFSPWFFILELQDISLASYLKVSNQTVVNKSWFVAIKWIGSKVPLCLTIKMMLWCAIKHFTLSRLWCGHPGDYYCPPIIVALSYTNLLKNSATNSTHST